MYRLIASLALGAAISPASAALPHALDGSWYNPAQSGHGLTLERIDHDSALLFWHVFDPHGNPLTLYVETRVEGDRLVGEALAPGGMRFDRPDGTLQLPFWGTIAIRFSDCTHATLSYDSPLAGYGRGEMPLVRLLPPKDADCSLGDPAGLASMPGYAATASLYGRYSTGVDALDEYDEARVYYDQAVGWVTSDGGLAFASGSDVYGTDPDEFVILGRPLPSAGGEARLAMTVRSVGWLDAVQEPGPTPAAPARRDDFPLLMRTFPGKANGTLFPRRIAPGAPEGRVGVDHASHFARDLRPGGYPFGSFELEVSHSLALCVRRRNAAGPTTPEGPYGPCVFTGQATLRPADFEFVLEGPGGTYRGVGLAQYCDVPLPVCTDDLWLVGDNGRTGLRIQSITSFRRSL